MATQWGAKEPQGIRDYGINWFERLGGIAIIESTWKLNGVEWVITELEKIDSTFTDTTTTVRVGGGTVGSDYLLTNHVKLANGEEDEQSAKLKIQER